MALEIDISATDDLDPNLTPVRGLRSIAQAVYRRLITPKNGFPFDDRYGLGVSRFINAASTPRATEAVVRRLVERQALEDERVDEAEAEVEVTSGNTLEIRLRLRSDLLGETELQLAISDVSAELLEIT